MDYHLYGSNRCSIAGVTPDFEGAVLVSTIVSALLARSRCVFASAVRPYCEKQAFTLAAVANLSNDIEDLNFTEDHISVSFYYAVRNGNDPFVNAVVQLWREYEQPGFFFFTSHVEVRVIRTIVESNGYSAKQKSVRIFDLAPCYFAYKAIEEDVIWIDKHEDIDFHPVTRALER